MLVRLMGLDDYYCRAVETTARSRNPTFVGFEREEKEPIWGFSSLQPHGGGVLLSCRGFKPPADDCEETTEVRG